MYMQMSVAALLLIAPIRAEPSDLRPLAGQSIELGGFQGVLYYTIEPEGYRVVATMATRPQEPPIRFISTLESGQRLTISVPGGVGEPARHLDIAREGDLLLLTESQDTVSVVDRW